MTAPRFLQIHTLSPYTGALLNRDDAGLAKRLPYGDVLRTRVSSQCLKRHWAKVDDPHALIRIDGVEAAYRSRELVTRTVIDPLRGRFPEDVVNALEPRDSTGCLRRQGYDQGEPSDTSVRRAGDRVAGQGSGASWPQLAAGDTVAAKKAAADWRKGYLANIKAMREGATLPAGLTAALFGRMVTSDPDANITAPVHVAHAFTVHEEEAESDYFTAVDDLSVDDPGADTIQETELTSGLFYGYVVVDLPLLIQNLGGDVELAGAVLHNFVYLIAEVSPGAKLGSTAPYGRASLMLLEAGDRQPRSLAEAYRRPCRPDAFAAADAMRSHLTRLDEAYDTGEERHVMTLVDVELPRAQRGPLSALANWAKTLPGVLG